MKKKIIFMVINMNIGGTEKALLNMIAEMPRDKYNITILMLEKYGGFLEFIPEHVEVKYLEGYKDIKGILNNPPLSTAKSLASKGGIGRAVRIFSLHLLAKVTKDRTLFLKYVLNKFPQLQEEYDVAVAYAGPMDFISYFVLKKIKAKKKLQWIHFDVTKIGFNDYFSAKLYRQFDKIYIVSGEARNKLIKRIPTLDNKTMVFKNIVSKKNIERLAKQGRGFEDNFTGFRILTVGRLTKEKGQDMAIKTLAKLIKDGYKVRWYCIGEGKDKKQYEELIQKYNLKDHFVMLGANPNPFPFISTCDIYVQPSRYEGYCITTLEAKYLEKPILTTDVNGAKEQFINGETAKIVEIEEEQIYMGIKDMINNKQLRKKLTETLNEINNNKNLIEPGTSFTKMF